MNPIDVPVILPFNTNPMLGQIDMEQLHVLGMLLVIGFVVACAVIGWKMLHATSQPRVEEQVDAHRRAFDQAA
jgi:hypothetical protein